MADFLFKVNSRYFLCLPPYPIVNIFLTDEFIANLENLEHNINAVEYILHSQEKSSVLNAFHSIKFT